MNDKSKFESIIINSYVDVWKFEKMIYSFYNFKLPVPINPHEFLYFIVTVFTLFVLSRIFSFINYIPILIKFALIPYLLTKFLTKMKFDGKNPIIFARDYILFLFTKKYFYERFKTYAVKEQKININWNVSKMNNFYTIK